MAGETFEKIRSSVNRGITTLSIKTSSSIEKSKIRMHIESLEKEYNQVLLKIGETAFTMHQNNERDFNLLDDLFALACEKKEEIERLSEELSGIDDRDNQILGTARENAVSDERKRLPESYICVNCGAEYETAIKFCRRCGAKMPE